MIKVFKYLRSIISMSLDIHTQYLPLTLLMLKINIHVVHQFFIKHSVTSMYIFQLVLRFQRYYFNNRFSIFYTILHYILYKKFFHEPLHQNNIQIFRKIKIQKISLKRNNSSECCKHLSFFNTQLDRSKIERSLRRGRWGSGFPFMTHYVE